MYPVNLTLVSPKSAALTRVALDAASANDVASTEFFIMAFIIFALKCG
jgi:hypothetical protein